MKKIKILPENISNKIAAGEVVERPASIVKELVENSIDAGATRIDVEIKNAGTGLIKVTDDGCGMSKDDALLSLEKHATSKIASIDDVYKIESLGFRGEALPSIASVSRFSMSTNEDKDLEGTTLAIEGGKIVSVKDIGINRGTIISVQDLFFNVPARKKFLKTPHTEMSHIVNMVTLNALPYDEIAFSLTDNNKKVFDIEKGMDLKTRITQLYGSDCVDQLIAVDWKSLDVKIRGFISKPEHTFLNRSKQYYFVNNRACNNRTMLYALSQGYRTLIPDNRHPMCFLFISINPKKVDVNIHPTKRDVRFTDEYIVKNAIIECVRDAFQKSYDMPSFEIAQGSQHEARPENEHHEKVQTAIKRFFGSQDNAGAFQKTQRTYNNAFHNKSGIHDNKDYSQETMDVASNAEMPRLLGQAHSLYIVCEDTDGIIILDQHAAHERVLYEKTMYAMKNCSIDSQKLLLPVTIEVSKSQHIFLSQHEELFKKAGIEINNFGDNTIIIDSVPPFVRTHAIKELMIDIISQIEEESRITKTNDILEEKLIKTLCRKAVKANDLLSGKEQHVLLKDLFKCTVPHTCPHGRPTMIKISYSYLDKEFKRR
ncbi:MAG: DNA mismatch repair endonuclease MutL [Candidatus Ancaeobacter aquaticus]|nr:DNA mismatch repair endonuclease MutL [Candidatus Ancaeobacter aquaticus]